MKTIKVEITNQQERNIKYFLQCRYGKKKRSLNNLAKIAISEIVAIQAREEAEEKIALI